MPNLKDEDEADPLVEPVVGVPGLGVVGPVAIHAAPLVPDGGALHRVGGVQPAVGVHYPTGKKRS